LVFRVAIDVGDGGQFAECHIPDVINDRFYKGNVFGSLGNGVDEFCLDSPFEILIGQKSVEFA
jgi:hypothetical protein